VPFAVMLGSVFFSKLSDEIAKGSKLSVALGGAIGLIYVIGELVNPSAFISPPSPQPESRGAIQSDA